MDAPVVNRTTGSVNGVVSNAWISVDLSSLKKTGELNIFKMMPATFMRGEDSTHNPEKLSDAHESVLMTIYL